MSLSKSVQDVEDKRSSLHARFLAGELVSYTLRREGNYIVFEWTENISRKAIKIDRNNLR